jgi:hypothetical protein
MTIASSLHNPERIVKKELTYKRAEDSRSLGFEEKTSMKILPASPGALAKGPMYPGILDSSNPFLTDKGPPVGPKGPFSDF